MSGTVALNGSVLNHELIFGGGSPRGELGSGEHDAMSATRKLTLVRPRTRLVGVGLLTIVFPFVIPRRRRLSFQTSSVGFTTRSSFSGSETFLLSQYVESERSLHHLLCSSDSGIL